jgi:uncharacterized protein (DUF3084 family)
MADNTQDMTPRILQAIQEEQALTNRKLGTLAEAIVSLRREVQANSADIQSVALSVHGLKNDIHTLAIAIDSYGDRLRECETRLGRIEQRLDRPN